MSSSIFPILLGAGGVALAMKGGDVESSDAPRRGEQVNPTAPPASPPATGLAALKRRHGITAYGLDGTTEPAVMGHRMEEHTSVPREIMDRAEKRMREEYNRLNGEAKSAVCREMKAQFPGDEAIQQMDCSTPLDWEALTAVAISAAGVAGATAICGPVCGAIAAPLAGVIGVKVADWGASAWDDLSDDAQEIWDESTEWIEESYEDAKDWVSDNLNPLDYI
jgi:hypothetical protein